MVEKPPRLSVLARQMLVAVRNIGNTLQEQNKAAAEANKSAEMKRGVAPEVRVDVVHLPPTIETQESTREARRDRTYQRCNVWISGLTFIAVVVYASLAWLQWREMIVATDTAADAVHEARRSRQQAERALISSNTFAAKTLTEMQKQTIVAGQQASLQRQIAVTTSGVHIVWSGLTFHAYRSRKLWVTVGFLNDGKVKPDSVSYVVNLSSTLPSEEQRSIFKNIKRVDNFQPPMFYFESERTSKKIWGNPDYIYAWGEANYMIYGIQVPVPFCQYARATDIFSFREPNSTEPYVFNQPKNCEDQKPN